jgi:hypothetical protein
VVFILKSMPIVGMELPYWDNFPSAPAHRRRSHVFPTPG